MKRFLSVCLTIILGINLLLLPSMNCYGATETALDISSPSVVLMELSSGRVLYEKDGETARRPASVTKIMTMLLVFDAIKEGKLSLQDTVTISEHAASMGGSQVYLEPMETQTVHDLLKCMIISSANDAAVALAESVAGSEESFVAKMNEKAKELGMKNTNFVNACGLEAEGHMMSAMDIAVLSRHLLLNHKEVLDYSTIWMDTIIHKTAKGESEFGLASTNKFLKKYEGANGLKTGYTSAAGFSMSATATRQGMTLIAVVMGSETKEMRYGDAAKLLDYGFANCSIYEDAKVLDGKTTLSLKGGQKDCVKVVPKSDFQYAIVNEGGTKDISKKMKQIIKRAPVKKGDVVAKMHYYMGKKQIGTVDILAAENVEEEQLSHAFLKIVQNYIYGK